MKKVIVLLSESLIGKGVESILSREKDLSVTSTSFIDDATLNQQIERDQPDVVILDERLEIADLSCMVGLLKENPELRVIVVEEQQNLIHVYQKQEIIVTRVADLIDTIRRI